VVGVSEDSGCILFFLVFVLRGSVLVCSGFVMVVGFVV